MSAPRGWGSAPGAGGPASGPSSSNRLMGAAARTKLQGVSYEILGKIGEGTYGVVYLLRYNDRKRSKVAVKTFKVRKVPYHTGSTVEPPSRVCLVRGLQVLAFERRSTS
eukprot:6977328-Pyramimonas_sp.AAC.1